MQKYQTPGIYREEVYITPSAGLRTGVPAFLGFTEKVPKDDMGNMQLNVPRLLTQWQQFKEYFGSPLANGYLAYTVRGFFENDGIICYVVPLESDLTAENSLHKGLNALEPLNTIDLICAPDIMMNPAQVIALQQIVLDYCDKAGDRFAILDSLLDANVERVTAQREDLSGTNGALYYPWIRVSGGPEVTDGFLPPCGHVAGIFSLSDQRVGVHKAPANEILKNVLDLEINVTNTEQDTLNPIGVNCLRAFPGRGIRVWGARTLSREPAWTYINVRRLFLTAGRWIEHHLTNVVFEPNDNRLWKRIRLKLTTYFDELFRKGALKGRTAQEAFYVKCDSETNPKQIRERGMVVTEIGLAPTVPTEFIIVRIIHGPSGITITGPTSPPDYK